MTKGLKYLMVCGMAAATALTAAPPAGAQTVEEIVVIARPKPGTLPETLTYRVSYADVDLTKPEGEKELTRRVTVAADFICGIVNPGVNPNACVVDAVNGSKKQIQKAKVAQMSDPKGFHAGKTWTPPPGKQ